MTPEEIFVPVPGGRIFTLQWGEGPLLLFTHATGMCARVYLQLLEPLGAKFRVVAPDARGHGLTELEADPARIPADWKIYGQDLRHLVSALGGGPVRLAGHSFGAAVAFEAAAANPGLASSVCLIDPPAIPFEHADSYRAAREADGRPPNAMADQAERRRGRFASRAAVRAAYRDRGVFRDWPERALDDYLDGGLLAEGDGVRLACSPAWEAASFRGVTTTMRESLKAAAFPFTLLLAEKDSPAPAGFEAAVRALQPQAIVRRFPGTGHFLPVTHPELVRPWLEALT
ncbi:alpha/beta hydrolase [Sandaracinobacter sp. RS1-74]|uniref:alpha/beta fold hydrolase n=1 Tax=Sandaracinobacteroides sayramensis TaxID=2913411 RepID=UPI001EDA4271|nr:alpha/beta hydrolase [Sandaracinobacteroides sayramensis]MCG2839740.1 alpha/beta hydrolase [Sandaracinobacteroides sayramensis]